MMMMTVMILTSSVHSKQMNRQREEEAVRVACHLLLHLTEGWRTSEKAAVYLVTCHTELKESDLAMNLDIQSNQKCQILKALRTIPMRFLHQVRNSPAGRVGSM